MKEKSRNHQEGGGAAPSRTGFWVVETPGLRGCPGLGEGVQEGAALGMFRVQINAGLNKSTREA